MPADMSLLDYLEQNPWEAKSLIWTLNLDATPIYAIMPSDPYASVIYERLLAFVSDKNIERVSIPEGMLGIRLKLSLCREANVYAVIRIGIGFNGSGTSSFRIYRPNRRICRHMYGLNPYPPVCNPLERPHSRDFFPQSHKVDNSVSIRYFAVWRKRAFIIPILPASG